MSAQTMTAQGSKPQTSLAQKLAAPISWKAGDTDVDAFLDRLQGNIIKYHGRNNVVFLFCRFRDDATVKARAFLVAQAKRVASARHQLVAADTKRSIGTKDTAPFVCLFLTRAGYDYLGIPKAHQPKDAAFQAGMAAAKLNDPPPSGWDGPLQDPHAMILVAVSGPDAAQTEATDLLNQIGEIGDVETHRSGEIIGNQFFNSAGRGVENFGYVDGRSQPLVLLEDIPGECGIGRWPGTEFPVNQFVVPDPGVSDAHAYGSYFVFRKLEQDVRGFKLREDAINVGHDDNKNPEPLGRFINRDSAGVGRSESGTPYEITNDDGDNPAVTNDFTYGTDEPPRCPHFAHIRKVNPRTPETRAILMLRRGMTYGTRDDIVKPPKDPTMLVLDDSTESIDRPEGGVGLLFQSYQANIAAQFEATQMLANDPGAGGLDPVIGQAEHAKLNWPKAYGSADAEALDFYERVPGAKPGTGSYVKLLGGGYFFAPSLPFLSTL